jgi:hypothetical protein
LRNPDVILTVHQETRGEILFHRKIDLLSSESGVGRAKETALQKLRYAISRNPEKTCEPSISEDRWQQINASSISDIRGFKLSKKFDIATREIAIREIAIRSQPSISPGHVADIEGTVSVSAFGVSS